MKVLAIDTSNYVMGVSLIEEENVIGEIITNLTKPFCTSYASCRETVKRVWRKTEGIN